MDLISLKSLIWYSGVVSAIIGLIWMIWQLYQKGEHAAETPDEHNFQRKFLAISWSIMLLPALISILMIFISPAHTSMKGMLLSLIIGLITPLLLTSLESQIVKKTQTNKSISFTTFASLPLAGIGICLLFAGFVSSFYGIRADNLWLSFIIGSASGLFLLKISSNLIPLPKYKVSSNKMDTIFLVIQAAFISTILAGYHFSSSNIKTYFPLMVLISIFLSVFISTIPFTLKPEKKIMNILPGQLAVFITIFLGLCLFLVLKLNIQNDTSYPVYLYTIIAGVVTSVVFIIMMHGSASSVKGVDLSTGAMGLLILIGGIWFSFKWAMSFGITLYSMGLLSVAVMLIPYRSFESIVLRDIDSKSTQPEPPLQGDPIMEGTLSNAENIRKPEDKIIQTSERHLTWAALFTRGITLAGLVTVLFGLFKVFVQKSPLLSNGLDLAYADISLALFLGIFASLCLEGFSLTGNNIFKPFVEGNSKTGILNFTLSAIAGVVILISIGILFRVDGLGAFLIGTIIAALLGVFTYFAQRKEEGLYKASLSPLWVAASAYSIFLIKYKDVPDQLTRLDKQQIVIGMILLISVIYFWAHHNNRKAIQKDKNNKETDGLLGK
jgi:hypothetical protein